MNLLLGVSSSIAAHRALDLASNLRKRGHAVRAVLSPNVTRLIAPAAFEAMTGARAVTSVWDAGHEAGMDHLALTKWADAFAFCPASANTLATLAHGIASDAIGTFAIAWNKTPFIIAPAMNPEMWANAAVQANVSTLHQRGHRFIGPVVGPVACGDFGLGRLAPVGEIEQAVIEQFEGWEALPNLARRRVLISGGPTREFADDVRFISNPSTGRMAIAIAVEAHHAGAQVTLVLGPTEAPVPEFLADVRRVVTADEMHAAMESEVPGADVVVFAAAVSDWRPEARLTGKFKKSAAGTTHALNLVRTPDIALACSRLKSDRQRFVGFAAESDHLLENAQEKLSAKGFDLVFANPINEEGVGFATDANRGILLWRDGRRATVPSLTKRRIARRILVEASALL